MVAESSTEEDNLKIFEIEAGDESNETQHPDKVEAEGETNELFGLSDESSDLDLLKVFLEQGIPVILSFLLYLSQGLINLFFAGQYSQINNSNAVFAGVGLAVMFTNVSGLSLMVGMSSAVETLGSQNNGAGNYKEVGIVLQRSCCILSTFIIPIFILWQYAYDIFLALGVEESVCKVVQVYTTIRFVGVPLDVLNESYEKYLMSIGVMQPSMWYGICANVLLILLNYIFLFVLHYDYECLAWSRVIANYAAAVLQIGLSLLYPAVQKTLQPFNTAALTNWYEFIELGLPGTAMLCSEWWAYEFLTMFASLLGTTDTAAQTIIMQMAALAFMIPMGLGVASASLVGNSLGAGKTSLAIRLGKFSLKLIICIEVVVGIVIYFGGPPFMTLFTKDPEVLRIATSAIIFISIFEMFDGIQGTMSGVLRGAGKQVYGAIANVIAFYGFGLPMAWVLCFYAGFGVRGLFMGISFATLFQGIVLGFLLFYWQDYTFSTNLKGGKMYESVQTSAIDDGKYDFNKDDNVNDDDEDMLNNT